MNAAISQPMCESLRPSTVLNSAEAVAKPTRWMYVMIGQAACRRQDPVADPRRPLRVPVGSHAVGQRGAGEVVVFHR